MFIYFILILIDYLIKFILTLRILKYLFRNLDFEFITMLEKLNSIFGIDFSLVNECF